MLKVLVANRIRRNALKLILGLTFEKEFSEFFNNQYLIHNTFENKKSLDGFS